MGLIRSFFIAFSMYSRVPVPRVRWDEKDRRFVLLFFPLVGLLEGFLQWGLLSTSAALQLPVLLRAALLTAFPFFYTGGIHLDGFLDTVDALGSWRSRTERLAILKDVHTGSFAVLACVLLCLLQFSAWASLDAGVPGGLIVIPFLLSRSFSAMSLLLLPNARGEGSAYQFSSAASRHITAGGVILFSLAGLCYVSLFAASGRYPAYSLLIPLASFLAALYGALRARAAFGGMTGDLAGFLLTVSESAALVVTALAFHGQ